MRPLVIGIAGGTGSGKTTIAKNITRELPTSSIALIDHDSYYNNRLDLTLEERNLLNFDHPDSLDTGLLIEHVKALRSGNAVRVPAYDFKTHSRKSETVLVDSLPIVVVEGILVFADPELRSLFDMKIFVDTDADIRVFRRIRRDMEERGRTFESVREQYYKTVRPMHLQFVEPSKRWADIIIPEGGDNEAALDMITGKLKHVLANL
jgi:uridine kinase